MHKANPLPQSLSRLPVSQRPDSKEVFHTILLESHGLERDGINLQVFCSASKKIAS